MKPVVRISTLRRVEARGRGLEEMIECERWTLLGCPSGDVQVAWIDPENGDLCMTAYDSEGG